MNLFLGLTEEVLMEFKKRLTTVIILCYLSPGFDTIDIPSLLHIFEDQIGIRDVVLRRFKSFLSERIQKVKIDGSYSRSQNVLYETVQGSAAGPKLFNLNKSSEAQVFRRCSFTTSSFEDDSNGRKQLPFCFQLHILKNISIISGTIYNIS